MESNLNHSVRPIGVGWRRTQALSARASGSLSKNQGPPSATGAVGGPSTGTLDQRPGGIQFTAHAHSPNIRGVGSPGGVVLPATVGTECDPSLIGPVGGVEPPPTGH